MRKKYTKEQLVFFLKEAYKKLSRSPKESEIKKLGYPSASTYRKRFSSWNNALKEAQLKVNVTSRFTKDELSQSLKLINKETGKIPTASDLKKFKFAASYATYKKYFGTWENALLLSGMKKNESTLKGFFKKNSSTKQKN